VKENESEPSKEREKRREVGDRENLNYSADSHNTRTQPSQLIRNSGDLSFFHSTPMGNLHSIETNLLTKRA